MADQQKVTFTFEIIPGKSIGPFRLGMTSSEIHEAIHSLGGDGSLSLEPLGIVAWSRGNDGGWINTTEAGKCVRLGIRVFNNDHEIVLKGQRVNDISNEDAIALLESLAEKVSHSYGGFDATSAGIEAVRWENSDLWIDSFFVMEPRTE
jgi:hypothetical protein